jgi:hypothetical protein
VCVIVHAPCSPCAFLYGGHGDQDPLVGTQQNLPSGFHRRIASGLLGRVGSAGRRQEAGGRRQELADDRHAQESTLGALITPTGPT